MKTMRSIAILILVAAFSFGCGDKPTPAPPSQANVVGVWIRANYWASQGEKKMLADIDACAENGVSYGCEMAGWAETGILKDQTKFNEAMRLYKLAVKRCRKRGIFMVNSIANNNCHLKKHGNGPYAYTLTSVWPKLVEMVEVVKDLGPENQLIQPLAETQTSDGVKFEKLCAEKLSGFNLIYNGNGGRPSKGAYGWKYVAWHPENTGKKIPAGFMAISDCGSTILQLHGTYDGKANGNLKTWAAKCKNDGAILVGDYAFRYSGETDRQAMKYLKDGLR